MFKKAKKFVSFKIMVLSFLAIAFVGALSFSMTMTVKPKQAEAICCSDCCLCIISATMADISGWFQDWFHINLYTYIQLQIHQYTWFDWEFWEQNMLPSFMQMGVQLSTVGMQQVSIIGMFMDAKEQLETQRLLHELHARAHKDYHTSEGICEFGTRIKSLAASERKGEMNALILSERSTDRFLGNKDVGSSYGTQSDVRIRLDQYQTQFCDTHDNQDGLSLLCPTLLASAGTPPTQAEKDRFNKDIDFERTVMDPWTIDFDLTDDGVGNVPPSEADEEVVALANNLYGFDIFERPSYDHLENQHDGSVTELQQSYLDMRAVVAKTKVAENSFNAILALKGKGTSGTGAASSREFIEAYLVELGMESGDIDEYLGEDPSYYAQMEILTKKAYQTQQFYTNLYDKPANVERKGVAIQAIGLIQKFDLLKSYLRTEASLSILLELSVQQLQREVEDNIQAFEGKMNN
ncbi:MAG: hypothetical protein ACRBDL_06550 [Alphaproteobacteria bacterium]